MKKEFDTNEKLYRAVRNLPNFIRKDGSLTRAVFKYTGKGSNGCSVDRQMGRKNVDAIDFISSKLEGKIYSITMKTCLDAEIYVEYDPSTFNPYHSQMYENQEKKKMNDAQINYLILNSKKEKD